MTQLLYSAQTSEGAVVDGFVEANTAQQARDKLLEQGLQNIVLHQDPTTAGLNQELDTLSPADLQQLAKLQLKLISRPGLWPLWVEVAERSKPWLMVDAAVVAWGWWSQSINWVITGVICAALPFILTAWNYRHTGRYQQMLKAFALGDWNQVAWLGAKLRKIRPDDLQLQFDLAIRLAVVQAKQGQLQQALAAVAPWEQRLNASPGLYQARAAELVRTLGDKRDFVRYMQMAYEKSGYETSRTLDFALAHALYADIGQAEHLFATIDAQLLPSYAAGFLYWIPGHIALRQHHYDAALPLLAQGVTEFLKLSHNPAFWLSLAFCTCSQAMALHAAGELALAQKTLLRVWPIVRAHADATLIGQLQADGIAPAE